MNVEKGNSMAGRDVALASILAARSSDNRSADSSAHFHAQNASQTTSQQLKTLAHALDRGTFKLIQLLPEFDRSEAWRDDGQRSCIAWLNHYCGMSPTAAHDRKRVAYALEHLPIITQLFQLGELSWSKVRALTRIATAENERELASDALMMSASAIELRARQYRSRGGEASQTEEHNAAEQYANRHVHYRYDDNGMVSIKASLPPLEGTVVLKSLARAEDELFTDAHGKLTVDNNVGTTDMQGVIKRTAPQLRADALSLMAEKHLDAQGRDISTADRYQVVVHVDASALGITAESEGQAVYSRQATTEVETSDQKNVQTTQQTATPTMAQTTTQAAKCHIENGPAISANTAMRLLDNCTALPVFMRYGEPLAIGRKSRVWPAAIIRAVKTRDQHCQFPGCCASRHTQLRGVQTASYH